MLHSMTGFGRCLVENDGTIQQWEVRSVNSRYLDLKWRLPLPVRYMEANLEKVVRRHANRGRVEISLALQFAPDSAPSQSFDLHNAMRMLDNLGQLAKMRGDIFLPDYNQLLHVASLWSEAQYDPEDNLAKILEDGLTIALEDWNESRALEGKSLARDLSERFGRMEEWTELLSERAPEIKEDRLASLRERLTEAMANNSLALEDARFMQEMVILADRVDTTEELTRLFAHLERLQQLLQEGVDAGRRLDFTLQECFREINTCGNKLQDAQLARIVVDFKNELEKCREQVQNLE